MVEMEQGTMLNRYTVHGIHVPLLLLTHITVLYMPLLLLRQNINIFNMKTVTIPINLPGHWTIVASLIVCNDYTLIWLCFDLAGFGH